MAVDFQSVNKYQCIKVLRREREMDKTKSITKTLIYFLEYIIVSLHVE